MTEAAEIGPVDYIVVEFPGSRITGEALRLLVDLHDNHIIRILDLLFINKELDGSVRGMTLADLDHDGTLDLAVFEGASSGLLGSDDIADAGDVLEPGNSAALLVYENRWAGPVVAALHRNGAELVATGRIPAADIIAALEATEPAAQATDAQ
jgi:uncharacterized membrane protein